METKGSWIEDTLQTGAIAGVATTCAVAACGQAEDGQALAPINAVSHILWGDKAAYKTGASGKYTATGLALNALAVGSWAGVHEAAFGQSARRGDVPMALLGGAITSALAYITDYYVVPKRLTPGFEMRLSSKSMFAVYATLALSLGLASLLKRR